MLFTELVGTVKAFLVKRLLWMEMDFHCRYLIPLIRRDGMVTDFSQPDFRKANDINPDAVFAYLLPDVKIHFWCCMQINLGRRNVDGA